MCWLKKKKLCYLSFSSGHLNYWAVGMGRKVIAKRLVKNEYDLDHLEFSCKGSKV